MPPSPNAIASSALRSPAGPTGGHGDAISSRVILSWCIGLQSLLLLIALAGSGINFPAPASVPSADPSETELVPVAEMRDPGNHLPPDIAMPPARPVVPASLTSLPDPIDAVAAAESPPRPLPADAIIDILPVPAATTPATPRDPTRQGKSMPGGQAGGESPAGPATKPQEGAWAAGDTSPGGPARLFTGAGSGQFPLPPYPAEARRRGIEGNVMLRVEVAPDGSPAVPVVESGSGHPLLDRVAVDWIHRHWRWDAGAARQFRIPIIFHIQ